MSKHSFIAFSAPSFLVVSALAQAPVPFPGVQYPMGGSPYAVALGDLNGDGKLDAVSADNYPAPGWVTVALGDGRGGFGAPARTQVGQGPQNVVLADLDHDQRLDAIATHDEGDGLSVLLGDGAGGWRSVVAFATGGQSFSVAVADLDLDGHLDLVTGTQFSQVAAGVSVLRGDGSGGFAAPVTFAVPNSFPGQVAIGLVDGDALPDVVTSAFTGIHLLRGDAANLLGTPTPLPPSYGGTPALVDLDEDGATDLVVVGGVNGSGSIEIFAGDGLGNFAAPRSLSNGAVATHALVQDIDGDGHVDVVSGDIAWTIRVLRGDGLGNLTLTQAFPGTWTLEHLAAGDLDGNGTLDLVAASRNNNSITPFLSQTPGRFHSTITPSDPNAFVTSILLLDADRDGAVDAMTSDQNGLHLRLGDFSGTFGNPPIDIPAPSVGGLTACDLDRDGRTDLAAMRSFELKTWLGDGRGGFAAHGTYATGEGARALALGDLDGDGKQDAVAITGVDAYPRQFSKMHILRGDGAGGFGAATTLDVLHLAIDVGLADLDLDGDLDIVSAHAGAAALVQIYFNDGTGGFGTPVQLVPGMRPVALALADIDDDRAVDIAVVTQDLFGISFALEVFGGDGHGGFSASRSFPFSVRPLGLTMSDVDGDGRLDAMVPGAYLQLALLFGDGSGGFGAPLNLVSGVQNKLVDVDADGRVDLISLVSGGIAVARNRLPVPAGVSPYGDGTPGCGGVHGTSVTAPPRIDSPDFGIVSTNVPPGALGVHYLAANPDVPGLDLFGIRFHVDLLAPWVSWAQPGSATATNTALARLPIPNLSHLVGATVFVQSTWVFPASSPCAPSVFRISSGRGLRLTLQP